MIKIICKSKINYDNIEDLEKLFQFTFEISGDCPSILNKDYKCDREDDNVHKCLYCWRKELGNKIKQLRGERE